MINPILTIIIPVYNAEKYIKQAVNSILSQTFKNFELLICDDASTDKSWGFIESLETIDSRIKIFRNSTNKGKIITVNSLINKCRGKYLTIHDADDWSERERFENQVEFLNKNAEFIGIGTHFYTHEKNGDISKTKLNLDSLSIKEGLIEHSQIHGPTLVFRMKALDKLNVIYRDFFEDYHEDYDLCVRLAQYGNLINSPLYLYHYRSLSDSLSKRHSLKRACSIKIMKHLVKQRVENGFDDLDSNSLAKINEILSEKEREYFNNPSQPLREQAEILFHNGFFRKAVSYAVRAISNEPFRLINYRLLQFMLRKKIFKV